MMTIKIPNREWKIVKRIDIVRRLLGSNPYIKDIVEYNDDAERRYDGGPFRRMVWAMSRKTEQILREEAPEHWSKSSTNVDRFFGLPVYFTDWAVDRLEIMEKLSCFWRKED